MTLVGAALLRRNHAYDLIATHLSAERTADTAVGTGCFNRAGWRTKLDDVLFLQGRRGAGLNTSTTGHTLAVHEQVATWADLGVESAAFDGKRECSLHLAAGAYTAATRDALGFVE